MKRIVAVGIVLSASLALAQSVGTTTNGLTASQKEKLRLEKRGGMITVPPVGPEIKIIDARKDVGPAAEIVVSDLQKVIRLNADKMVAEAADEECPFSLGSRAVAEGALLAVVIANVGDAKPMLCLAPEERVAVVNAERLGKGVGAVELEKRLVKEIWRAIGIIGGAGVSPQNLDVMKPVYAPSDLDAIREVRLNAQSLFLMNGFFRRFSVEQGGEMTYRAAVTLGRAPAPTNDIQRAVWDRVMAAKAAKAAATNAPSATPPAK